MLGVISLNVIKMTATMLSFVIMTTNKPSVVMLSASMLGVYILCALIRSLVKDLKILG
jgi:hypothetical protein